MAPAIAQAAIAPPTLAATKCLNMELKAESFDFTAAIKPGLNPAGVSRCQGCPLQGPSLTALLPDSHNGTTLRATPTLWFYLPYDSTQILAGELRVMAPSASTLSTGAPLEVLERQSFQISPGTTAGLISVPWPATLPLQAAGDEYFWSLAIYCGRDNIVQELKLVNGWVHRVATTAELTHALATSQSPDTALARHQIWLDAVDTLATARSLNPSDPTLQGRWQTLMTAAGVTLDHLPDEVFSGSVTLTESGE